MTTHQHHQPPTSHHQQHQPTANQPPTQATTTSNNRSDDDALPTPPATNTTDDESDDDVNSNPPTFETQPDENPNDSADDAEPWVDWIKRCTHEAEARMKQLKLDDWVTMHRRRKWKWAHKIMSMPDDNWMTTALRWDPNSIPRYTPRRRIGRPRLRWTDDLCEYIRHVRNNETHNPHHHSITTTTNNNSDNTITTTDNSNRNNNSNNDVMTSNTTQHNHESNDDDDDGNDITKTLLWTKEATDETIWSALEDGYAHREP